jgi:hypothetical protein
MDIMGIYLDFYGNDLTWDATVSIMMFRYV